MRSLGRYSQSKFFTLALGFIHNAKGKAHASSQTSHGVINQALL